MPKKESSSKRKVREMENVKEIGYSGLIRNTVKMDVFEMSQMEKLIWAALYCLNTVIFILSLFVLKAAHENAFSNDEFNENFNLKCDFLSKFFTYVIISASVVAFTSFLGFVSSHLVGPVSMIPYTILLIIVIVMQLTVMGVGYAEASGAKCIENGIMKQINNSFELVDTPLNDMQRTYNCCGFNSYEDYTSRKANIPLSCCENATKVCNATEAAKVKGCKNPIHESATEKISSVKYFMFSSVAVEIILFVITIVKCCIKPSPRYSTYFLRDTDT